MKRILAILVSALVFGGLMFLAVALPTGAAQRASTCSDSWNSDGHIGPWYTSSNSTLHGNSLHIACPSSGTAWSVTYLIEREANGALVIPLQTTRTGTGTTSFSISVSPTGCAKAWDYWSYAHNNKTGGNISKPSDHLNVICV